MHLTSFLLILRYILDTTKDSIKVSASLYPCIPLLVCWFWFYLMTIKARESVVRHGAPPRERSMVFFLSYTSVSYPLLSCSLFLLYPLRNDCLCQERGQLSCSIISLPDFSSFYRLTAEPSCVLH